MHVEFLRYTFRSSSSWKAAFCCQITASQTLLRTRDYALVEVLTTQGAKRILKVSLEVLPHLSTSRPCVMYIWHKYGSWHAGVKMPPADETSADEFIMQDLPDVPPGVSDPGYKPQIDDFEPWAMEFEKFDRMSGYGLTQSDPFDTEPWVMLVSSKFDTNSKTIHQESSSKVVHHTVCHHDTDNMYTGDQEDFEPWAQGYTYSTKAVRSVPVCVHPYDDPLEPWAMYYNQADRTSGERLSRHAKSSFWSSATPFAEFAQPEGFEKTVSFARDDSIPPPGCFAWFSLPKVPTMVVWT